LHCAVDGLVISLIVRYLESRRPIFINALFCYSVNA